MRKLFLIFSLSLIIACSKDEPEPQIDPLPSQLITTRSDGTYYGSRTYKYDDNKLVSIIFNNSESENSNHAELIYSDNVLMEINRYDGNDNLRENIILNYTNNRLEEYTYFIIDQNTANKIVVDYPTDNTIIQTTYAGDFDNQTEFIGETVLIRDANFNITEVKTADYHISYNYDSKNGVFKNLVARDILNLIGKLNGPLNRGGMNNATSYEWSNNSVSDHIDLNYEYNDKSYPITRIEFSPEFGEGLNTLYKY